jgi:hypothetical protein
MDDGEQDRRAVGEVRLDRRSGDAGLPGDAMPLVLRNRQRGS